MQRRAMPLARRNQFYIFKNGDYQLPELSENPFERYKILSGFLYPWARTNGFQQRAKYIGILQQGDFLSMIACKTIFKDSSTTADLYHGVWSHAIQWYCIFEHQKAAPFLQHEAMEVYQSFGSDEQISVKKFLQTAWDKIMDRLDARHFTSPPQITAILSKRSSLKRWPLLCESIVRQERKTHEKFGDYDHYGDYLEKKHADEHDHYKIVKKLKIR